MPLGGGPYPAKMANLHPSQIFFIRSLRSLCPFAQGQDVQLTRYARFSYTSCPCATGLFRSAACKDMRRARFPRPVRMSLQAAPLFRVVRWSRSAASVCCPSPFVARSARSSPPLSAKTCDGLGSLARFACLCRQLRLLVAPQAAKTCDGLGSLALIACLCRLLRLFALPLQAGTPLWVSCVTFRYAHGDTRHPALRASLPL